MKTAILIIGSCNDEAIVYRTVLESSGYLVLLAENQEKAIKLIESFKLSNLAARLSLVILLCQKTLNSNGISNKLDFLPKDVVVWSFSEEDNLLSSKKLLTRVRDFVDKKS